MSLINDQLIQLNILKLFFIYDLDLIKLKLNKPKKRGALLEYIFGVRFGSSWDLKYLLMTVKLKFM